MPGGTTRPGGSIRMKLVPLPGFARPIRVVIVENHSLIADSLGAVLEREEGIEVVATAKSLAEVTSLPPDLAPDVVTMDFHLDDGTGYDAALLMRAVYPGANSMLQSVVIARELDLVG